ncbi:hypothetical protein AVEN_265664-1 [Araneus ventricosus]|uniref:Uncharacterized protein n=1 Tax=Araneus ventricosus TaxID=182803 RepID=A0A4Y2NAD7_ARAVE|nr:hypothetical protein AVEN_265664-1 [Araneus ventricosus]
MIAGFAYGRYATGCLSEYGERGLPVLTCNASVFCVHWSSDMGKGAYGQWRSEEKIILHQNEYRSSYDYEVIREEHLKLEKIVILDISQISHFRGDIPTLFLTAILE